MREAGRPQCWHQGRKPFREETRVSLRKQVVPGGLRVPCVGEPWSPHHLVYQHSGVLLVDLQLVFTDTSRFGVYLFPCHLGPLTHLRSQIDHDPYESHDGHPQVLLCTHPTLLWTPRLTVWGFIGHLVFGPAAAPLLFQTSVFFITGLCKIPTCSL